METTCANINRHHSLNMLFHHIHCNSNLTNFVSNTGLIQNQKQKNMHAKNWMEAIQGILQILFKPQNIYSKNNFNIETALLSNERID